MNVLSQITETLWPAACHVYFTRVAYNKLNCELLWHTTPLFSGLEKPRFFKTILSPGCFRCVCRSALRNTTSVIVIHSWIAVNSITTARHACTLHGLHFNRLTVWSRYTPHYTALLTPNIVHPIQVRTSLLDDQVSVTINVIFAYLG